MAHALLSESGRIKNNLMKRRERAARKLPGTPSTVFLARTGSRILSLNVLLVASEAVPLAKTGGLGDMVSAYAAALREAGVDATILMPAYPGAIASAEGLHKVCALPGLPGGDGALLRGRMPDTGVPLLLVRCDALYARAGLYQDEQGRDYTDNAVRFAALSTAAVRIARRHPRREEARHRSRARLAFRPHAAPDETRGRQGEERLHDPQPRVPGQLRAVARRDARRARRMARARADRAEEHRVLRRVEPDESGHRPRRFRHDGQRDLRPRNPHAALRPSDGRRAAKLRGQAFGRDQRHRRQDLESRDRSADRAQLFVRRYARQARLQARAATDVRPARRSVRAADGDRQPHDRAEDGGCRRRRRFRACWNGIRACKSR